MHCNLTTIVILAVAWLAIVANGHLFSSMAKLEPLLKTEEELLDSVQEYVRLEKQQLFRMERLVEEIKQERINPSSARSNGDSPTPTGGNFIDLGNPIQSYLLLRRLRHQWHEVKGYAADLTNQMHYLETFRRLWNSDGTFPFKEDLTGSVRALLRLQEIYRLKTSDLADGRLLGQQKSAPLLASDCFDIGREAWIHNEHFYDLPVVVEWMMEALRKEKQTDESSETNVTREKAEKLLTLSEGDETANVQNMRNAMNIVYQLVTQDSKNETPAPNLHRTLTERVASTIDLENITTETRYFALCRGDESVLSKPKNPRLLVCRYNHHNRPGLRIRPAKEEVLASEPPVVYYHDMLTDHEINLIKERARPLMERSMIGTTDGESTVNNEIRVSNIAWLLEVFDKADELGKILPRVEDCSNLKTGYNASEPLQVANYGLGGHYHPHFDDYTEGVSEGHEGMGKRIATVLYYLSDVEAGGATVFINAGIRVPPVKGSAVIWYNYLKNGEIDRQALHAGCPVLMGYKWASNLWIREHAQVFRRKCGLTQDDIY
ncbi:prolyl 4-hydroxylase subunit alpha-2-like isoform X1 [Amphiura filiformis]|uniref:prolyl 4-hydroxylase subunit alpha-2-like isoform X1 n=1 Tax=Amphiura filiformis TaxID=82378 RepID=UPI003B218F04